MPQLEYIREFHVRIICERMTATLFPGSPSFALRGAEGRHRLLAALAQPRWSHYRTLPVKAATLHFHLNKGHAYADGNKRLALVTTELFLNTNGAVLVASPRELKDLALAVADNVVSREENEQFFRERVLRTSWSSARFERWLGALGDETHQYFLSDEFDARSAEQLTAFQSTLAELRAPQAT